MVVLSLGQAVLGVPVGAQSSGDSKADDGSGQDADDGGGGPTDEGSDEAVPVEVGPPPGGLPGRAGEPGPGSDGGGGSAVAGEPGSPPLGFEFPKPGCPPGYVCGASSPLPAPTGLTCASATTNSITFSWDRVTGSTKYSAKIQLAVAGSRQTENTTTSESTTFTGLSPGKKYFIGVLALQGSVVGHWSGANCWTTPVAPSLRCGTATSSSIEVRWTKPRGATEYQIWSLSRWITPSGSFSHEWSGLSASEPYWSYVRAGNMGGWSSWSSRKCYTKAAPLPAPTGLMCASATTNSITFSWNGVTGATKYSAKIQLAVVGSRQAENTTTGERTTFTGLSPGTRYYIGVLALQGTVAGHSNAGYCWTRPAKPVMKCGTATSSSIEVTWTGPDGATKYQVWTDSGWIDPSGSRSHVWSGLDSSQTYTRYVRAGNTAWWGAAGTAMCTTNLSPPSCEADSSDSVTLRFADGGKVHSWQASRLVSSADSRDGRPLARGKLLTVFDGLEAGTTYVFRVQWRASADDRWSVITPDTKCATEALGGDQCVWYNEAENTKLASAARVNDKCVEPAAAKSARTTACSSDGEFVEVVPDDDADSGDADSSGSGSSDSGDADSSGSDDAASENQEWRLVLVCFPLSSGTGKYQVSKEVLAGVLYAAKVVFNDESVVMADCKDSPVSTSKTNPRPALTRNRLAAILLSIPVHELAGGTTSAVSPLSLSRSDNLSVQKNNVKLYSHRTLTGYVRAFWNPGVGLWQLDNLGSIVEMNHAERADAAKGGERAARVIAEQYCMAGQNYYSHWVACGTAGQICKATHLDLLTSGSLLNVRAVDPPGAGTADSTVADGITERRCRWGDDGAEITCHIYDTRDLFPTGFLTTNPDGTGSQFGNDVTPLSAPFISFTHDRSDARYAVWPSKCTGYGATIIRAVPKNREVRKSPMFDLNIYSGSVATEKEREKFLKHVADNISMGTVLLVGRNPNPEGWFNNAINYTDNEGNSIKWDLQIKTRSVDVDGQTTITWVSTNHSSDAPYLCNDF